MAASRRRQRKKPRTWPQGAASGPAGVVSAVLVIGSRPAGAATAVSIVQGVVEAAVQ